MFTTLTNWLRPTSRRRRPVRFGSVLEALEDRSVPDATYFALNSTPTGVFTQDWTNTGLLTVNNNWGAVPSIVGQNGAGLAAGSGTAPGSITGAGGAQIVTVDQNNPNTFAPGGIAEFQISDPTVAFSGSTSVPAPHLIIHVDTRGTGNVRVSFNARDLVSGATPDTNSSVALQFRASDTGNFTGVPFNTVTATADITVGSGTKSTPVAATLPVTANDRQFVQIRIITTNAEDAGGADAADEWIGIDDIVVDGNMPPVLAINGATLKYEENDAITFVDSAFALNDPDSNDFDGGVLTVNYLAVPTADDRLIVNNQGAAVGNISTTGTIAAGLSVQFTTASGTATIGTVNPNGGVGTTPLIVTFTSSAATQPAIRALLRNIGYLNTSDDPVGGIRNVQFTISDGDGRTSNLVTRPINVIPINDSPVIALGSPLVIPEGNPPINAPVTISPTATITDPDSHDYDGGTLSVFIPVASLPTAFDHLTIEDQGPGLGLVGVVPPALPGDDPGVTYSGVVIGTFTGGLNGAPLVITFNPASAPTPESIQAVARAIQYQNTSDDPPNNPRPIRFVADDNDDDAYGNGVSVNVQVTVTIQPINDQPEITPTRAGFTYTENDAPTAIDATLTLADPDSPNFSGGTLEATYLAGGTSDDRLTVRHQGTAVGDVSVAGNVVSYNSGSGPVVVGNITSSGVGTTKLQVTFNPSATLAAVQAVLQNVSYSNISDNPATPIRTVQIILGDGDGDFSPAVTWDITVQSVNDGPTIGAIPVSLTYEAGFPAVVVAPVATVTDPDSANLNTGYFRVETIAGGLNADVIGIRNQGTALGRIGVSGSTVTYGGAPIGTFTGGTLGNPLVVSLNTSAATPAAIQALAAAITFRTPNGTGVTGIRTVQFSALDSGGGTVSNMPAIGIDVTSSAGPNDDFYEINEDAPPTGTLTVVAANGVLVNDPNAAQLTANPVPVQPPNKGSLTLGTDGSFQYVPTPHANGTDTFTYQWIDSTFSTTGTAVVTIIINPVNDAPTAAFTAPDIEVLEDSGAYSEAGFALMGPGGGTDEAGQTVTRAIVNNNQILFGVQPSIDPSGRLTFTLAVHANGTATVTLTLTDNGGTFNNVLDDDSADYTFLITVKPVNDIPTFQVMGNPPAVMEDAGPQTVTGFALNFLAGPAAAKDETTQTPTYVLTPTGTTGDLTFSVAPSIAANGDLTYTAAPNSTGSANFVVVVQDDGGTDDGGTDTSGPRNFTINVGPVDDPPTLDDDTATVLWNSEANPIDVLDNDSGAPDAGDTVSVTGFTPPAHGTVVIQPGGTGVTYQPTPGYEGPDVFTYVGSDAKGNTSTAVVTVNVVRFDTQPEDIVAIGTGPGGGSKVRLYDAKTGQYVGGFSAYAPEFQGGVSVAMADVNGDNVTDVIVGAGPGGGPHIQVIDGNRFGLLQGLDQIAPPSALIGNFFGYDFAFRGGVTVAAGDVNGDGKADIILGTGPGGAAHIRIVSGAKIGNIGVDYQPEPSALLANFFAYDSNFRGGVLVATGDVNRDGYFDVIAAAGPGGASHVKAFHGRRLFESGPFASGVLLASFYGFDPNFRGGATIAAGDFNNDGFDDFIVGAGPGAGSHVKVFSPFNLATPIASFFAFEAGMNGGVSVGYRTRSGGSTPLLLAGTGSGTNTRLATFAPPNFNIADTVGVFDPGFLGGVDVG